jgi:hypothetical protein
MRTNLFQTMSDTVDNELWQTVPQFAKGTCLDSQMAVSAALATESADSLPPPPQLSDLNAAAYATIRSHPDLFKIVTPIKVDRFEEYLKDHPNREYVDSVCCGLRHGFWPWTNHMTIHAGLSVSLSAWTSCWSKERRKFSLGGGLNLLAPNCYLGCIQAPSVSLLSPT